MGIKTSRKTSRKAPRKTAAPARRVISVTFPAVVPVAPAPAPYFALPVRSLTIRREGQVEWKVGGATHCGPVAELRDGIMPIRYTAIVKCAPTLDERGFLFDQAALDTFVRRLASVETPLSCEMLVRWVAEEILRKIARDVPTCRVLGLSLTLSPAPFAASITAVYGDP